MPCPGLLIWDSSEHQVSLTVVENCERRMILAPSVIEKKKLAVSIIYMRGGAGKLRKVMYPPRHGTKITNPPLFAKKKSYIPAPF